MTDVGGVDALVIGAGVVGLACARALAATGRETLVLESTATFGSGTSSRNSEVIHAGIYYPPGSLKARLCVAGRRALLDFCADRNVPFALPGKLIVATKASQVPDLDALGQRALDNGVVDLESVDAAALATAEPAVRGSAALYSPGTGIIDAHAFMLALLADLDAAGGSVAYRSPVRAARALRADRFELDVAGPAPCRIQSPLVVNAAGLAADRVAGLFAELPEQARPRHHLARGRYYSYHGPAPFRHLVYPLPEPGGLGVHVTLDLAGRVRFGPDVAWIDTEDYAFDDRDRAQFVTAIRQYFPGLEPNRLQPDYCGIRPRLGGADVAFADFRIDGAEVHGLPGLVNLFGIESPGLTAALAIADAVVARLQATG